MIKDKSNRLYFLKNNTDQESAFPFPFGISLLFVTFLVLGIFTFAVLTLVAAKDDYTMSRKSASHQSAYYMACNKAEDRIAALNRKLKAAGGTGDGLPETVSFQTAIDGSTTLSVTVQAVDAEDGDTVDGDTEDRETEDGDITPYYEVTQWKVESAGEWSPAQTVPVMPPSVSAD
ncbi:MAG: hypothetical protein LIV24_03300 [Eubacterium sp.]|nr:hypothetical protein [Eubacterium sp.]